MAFPMQSPMMGQMMPPKSKRPVRKTSRNAPPKMKRSVSGRY